MSLTTLNVTAIDALGDPYVGREVIVTLVAGTPGATIGDAVVVSSVAARLDSDGETSFALTPNEEITDPEGTFYRVTVKDTSPTIERTILLPVSEVAVSWADPEINVVSPQPPDHLARNRTTIEGSTVIDVDAVDGTAESVDILQWNGDGWDVGLTVDIATLQAALAFFGERRYLVPEGPHAGAYLLDAETVVEVWPKLAADTFIIRDSADPGVYGMDEEFVRGADGDWFRLLPGPGETAAITANTGTVAGFKPYAVVGAIGRYETPDVGAFDTDGAITIVEGVALRPNPAADPGEFTYHEMLTQNFNSDEAPVDQDGDETAIGHVGSTGVVFGFHEHCRIDTPPETEAGEYAPGRIYTNISAGGYEIADRTAKFAAGVPVRFMIWHVFDEGGGTWAKELLVPAGLGTVDRSFNDEGWRIIRRRVGDDVDSLGNSGENWVVGISEGEALVAEVKRWRGIADPELVLHFDPADVQGDGTIVSSLVDGQVWTPINDPFVIDLSPANLALIGTGGGGGVSLGETSGTAYRGDRGKTAYDHSQLTTGNPHGTTAADVGAAASGHNHSGVYSPAGHDHSGVYQPADADLTALAAMSSPATKIPSTVVLGSDQGSSSTTLADTTGLAMAVTSGVNYVFEIVLWVTGATAGDLKVALTFPSGTAFFGWSGPPNSASSTPTGTQTTAVVTATGGTFDAMATLDATTIMHVIKGYYLCSSSGTLQVQHAQRNSSGTATTIKAGSFIEAHTA